MFDEQYPQEEEEESLCVEEPSRKRRLNEDLVRRNTDPDDFSDDSSGDQDGVDDSSQESGDEQEQEEDPVEKILREKRKKTSSSALHNASMDNHVRVGANYQALLEVYRGDNAKCTDKEKEWILWKKPDDFNLEDCESYIDEAAECGMTCDRALFILQNSNFDVDDARRSMRSRKVVEDEWCEDDEVLFRQSYLLYGKNFGKIHMALPHKSVGSIVQHYYDTKKRWKQSSYLDHTSAVAGDETTLMCFARKFHQGMCHNCGHIVKTLTKLKERRLCYLCASYTARTNKARPADFLKGVQEEYERMPYVVAKEDEDLVDMFDNFFVKPKEEEKPPEENPPLRNFPPTFSVLRTKRSLVGRELRKEALDCQIAAASCYRKEYDLQQNKKTRTDLNKFRLMMKDKIPRSKRSNIIPAWSELDRYQAFHALLRYNLDFVTVSEIIGNKTPDMIRDFYERNREQLDRIIVKSQQQAPKEVDFVETEGKEIQDAPEVIDIC